jgi:hypothetical protein
LHSWWHSLLIGDDRVHPRQASDLAIVLWWSSLIIASQTSKAREGSRPPWVQIPPLPPLISKNADRVNCDSSGVSLLGLSCRLRVHCDSYLRGPRWTGPVVAILGKAFGNIEGSIRYLAPELSFVEVLRTSCRQIMIDLFRELLSKQQVVGLRWN